MSSSRQPAMPQPSRIAPVDAELAELVDQQRQPPATAVLQQMADQAGLSGTEKAGDDGGRDFRDHGWRTSGKDGLAAARAATAVLGQWVVTAKQVDQAL